MGLFDDLPDDEKKSGLFDDLPGTTLTGEFVKGVKSGVDATQQGLYGLASLAGHATGLKPVEDWGREGVARNEAEMQENPLAVARLQDIGGVKDAALWAAGGLGQLAPFMAGSVLSGGAGAVAGGALAARAGLSAAARQAAIRAGALAGAGGASVGQETGSIVADQIGQGQEIDPGKAIGYGLAAGALDVLPQARLFNKILPGGKVLRDAAGREIREGVLSDVAKQIGAEAVTEGAQTFLERAGANREAFSPEGIDEAINAAALGGLGGGVMGGGVRAYQAVRGPSLAERATAPPAESLPDGSNQLPGGTIPGQVPESVTAAPGPLTAAVAPPEPVAPPLPPGLGAPVAPLEQPLPSVDAPVSPDLGRPTPVPLTPEEQQAAQIESAFAMRERVEQARRQREIDAIQAEGRPAREFYDAEVAAKMGDVTAPVESQVTGRAYPNTAMGQAMRRADEARALRASGGPLAKAAAASVETGAADQIQAEQAAQQPNPEAEAQQAIFAEQQKMAEQQAVEQQKAFQAQVAEADKAAQERITAAQKAAVKADQVERKRAEAAAQAAMAPPPSPGQAPAKDAKPRPSPREAETHIAALDRSIAEAQQQADTLRATGNEAGAAALDRQVEGMREGQEAIAQQDAAPQEDQTDLPTATAANHPASAGNQAQSRPDAFESRQSSQPPSPIIGQVAPPAVRPQLFVERGGRRFEVASLEDAAAKWSQFRDETRAGASEIGEGARIVDQTGVEIGRISYNGKVWPPGEWHSGMKPLVGENFKPSVPDAPTTPSLGASQTAAGTPTLRPHVEGLITLNRKYAGKGDKLRDAIVRTTAIFKGERPATNMDAAWLRGQARKFEIAKDKPSADALMSVSEAVKVAAKGVQQSPTFAEREQRQEVNAPETPALAAASPNAAPQGKAAEATEPKQEFNSTQVALPPMFSAQVKATAKSIIAPADIDPEHGLEDRPHVTVKYGLHDNNPDAVRKLVEGEPPVTGKVTGLEVFSPEGKDYDVLVARVDSPDLHRLNAKIAALPHTNTFPTYKPHITLGYVKKGAGEKYAKAKTNLIGKTFSIDTLEFSDQDEKVTAIPLKGKAPAPQSTPMAERVAKGDAEREAQAVAPAAQHIEGKTTEPATAPVVAKALAKGGDLRAARAAAVEEVKAAIAKAPERSEARNQDERDSIGYVTIKVPGDGKFRILNTKENLQAFADKLAKAPGFAPEKFRTNAEVFGKPGGGFTPDSTIVDLWQDREYLAALDLAVNADRALGFGTVRGAKDGERPVVYRKVSPVDMQKGVETFVGKEMRGDGGGVWRVVEKTTGLSLGEGKTQFDAVVKAKQNAKGKDIKAEVAKVKDKPGQDGLEAAFRAWAEKHDVGAEPGTAKIAEAETAGAEGPSPTEKRTAKEELRKDTLYRKLMDMPSKDVAAFVDKNVSNADAKELLDRLNAAPGDNRDVRAALEKIVPPAPGQSAEDNLAGQGGLTERPTAPTTIEDVGEKIGGARKDMAAALSREFSDSDIASLPLSKIWPTSDVDAIEDKFLAALAYAARAEIPTKPKTKYKVDRWVTSVKALRGLAQHALSGNFTTEQLRQRLKDWKTLDQFYAKVAMLDAIDRDQWGRIGKVGEYPTAYRYEDGKQVASPIVSVEIDGRSHRFEGSKTVADVVDQVDALLSKEVEAKRMQFEIRGRGDSYFINKKGDPEYRKLATFKTVEEARAYRIKNYDALVSAWEGVKDRDNVKETDVRSKENRPRAGQDWRKGKDVTAEQFANDFGFRGVEFGNWVAQGADAKERQGMLNQAYDALMDLATIVDIQPRAISLNGSLGLGFGSRGHGWASAHFEPDRLVINLTKTRGAGALGHEWFHALDNYFSRLRGGEAKIGAGMGAQESYRERNYITYKPEPLYVNKKGGGKGLTGAELTRFREQNPGSKWFAPENWTVDPNHPEGVRPQVEKVFAELVDALNKSPMAKRSLMIDRSENGYWSRIIERAARSFENYLLNEMMLKGYHNDYLANVLPPDQFQRDKGRYPYLLPEEVAPVKDAFDNLFQTIETKETDKGVALYSIGEGRSTGTTAADVEGWVRPLMRQLPNAPHLEVTQRPPNATPGARGEYNPATNTATLYADNLRDEAQAIKTFLHETVGHAGLRGVFGTQLDPILDRIYATNPEIRKLADAQIELAARHGKRYSKTLATEEALSNMAGEGRQNEINGWKMLVAVIRGLLRKLGIDVNFSENDVIAMLARSHEYLARRKGETRTAIGQPAYSIAPQTDTAAFRKWFGNSVVTVDGKPGSEPLRVYHGTSKDFAAFDRQYATKGSMHPTATAGFFFTDVPDVASSFSGETWDQTIWPPSTGYKAGANVMPVYLSISNPRRIGAREFMTRFVRGRFYGDKKETFEEWGRANGHDGILIKADQDLAESMGGEEYGADVWVAFRPEQIKSATGNVGTFDAANPDIRYSLDEIPGDTPQERSASLAEAPGRAHRPILAAAGNLFDDLTRSDRVLNRVISKFNTPYHLAKRFPSFAKVYNEAQAFQYDLSRLTKESADLAKDILPTIESFKDFRKSTPSNADTEASMEAVMAGTLWGGGNPLEGRRWTDEELRTGKAIVGKTRLDAFAPLNDKQISLYRQALASVEHSLNEGSKALIFRLAQLQKFRVDPSDSLDVMAGKAKDVMDGRIADERLRAEQREEGRKDRLERAPKDERDRLTKELQTEREKDEARTEKQIAEWEAFKESVDDIQEKTEGLIEHGYFPAMRFGEYFVNVSEIDPESGETKEVEFQRFDTQMAANAGLRRLREEYAGPGYDVTSGTINPAAHKLFSGMNIDALRLFSKHLRDENGNPIGEDASMQAFFRLATSERSSLKRNIHRKGVPGFSTDLPRVLSQFTVNNATAASRNYHGGTMTEAANAIRPGDLQEYATKYVRYLQDPEEEAHGVRSALANYYILGSIAFGAVNMTQPILVSAPYLSSKTSWTHAMASLGRAAKDIVGSRTGLTDDESKAFARAVEVGAVAPQEIHQIRAEGRHQLLGGGEAWRKVESMMQAKGVPTPSRLALRKLAFGWGSIYSMTEQFNRGTTFLAAYRIGKETGVADPYAFAIDAVESTQFTYNRANRPLVSRGPVGSVVMTFKTFSISYLELAKRLYKTDKKAFAVMMLTLAVLAGTSGLPFADDVEDLIDTIMQWAGYAGNSKKAVRRFLAEHLGKDLANVVQYGVSGIPGVPIDVANRLGMHNIIPGSAIFKVSEPDKTRDIVDVLGPAAGLARNIGSAVEGIATGQTRPLRGLAPTAVQNALQGAEMFDTGTYRDTLGRKVMDVDTVDSVSKMLGFQPSSVARESRIVQQNQQDISLQRVREAAIVGKWARGIYEKDREMIREALDELRDWNATNPELRIVIKPGQVAARVRSLAATREQRFLRAAPPEARSRVSEDIRK